MRITSERLYNIALMLIVGFILTITAVSVAYAEGTEYTGTKNFNCTDPDTRTDGTDLCTQVKVAAGDCSENEVNKIELYIRHGATDAPPEHTIIMPGGCQVMAVDLNQLLSGQKYVDGMTFDTDGRESVLATPQVPFVAGRANPNPPSGIVITD